MSRKSKDAATTPVAGVRCAIYTRKSTEEGLEQEFNSLDAQRESAEAYIKSQQHEGWTCLPDRYDDGGFTGGNMDRPALRRLMADIEAGRIDCVVVYKVDRLSRIAAGLCPADGQVRQAPDRLRVGHAAVQHDQLDGPVDAQRAAVVRAVRARDHLRADPRQDRGHAAQREMVRRPAAARATTSSTPNSSSTKSRPSRCERSSICTCSTKAW